MALGRSASAVMFLCNIVTGDIRMSVDIAFLYGIAVGVLIGALVVATINIWAESVKIISKRKKL